MVSYSKKILAVWVVGVFIMSAVLTGCGQSDTSVIEVDNKLPASLESSVVPNGGFEQWSDGKPTGWKLSKGVLFAEEHRRMGGSRSLNLQVNRIEKDKWPYCEMSSSQFSLEPNTEYRLSAWVALKGEREDVKFEVIDSDGSVVGSYHSCWLKDHPWLQISMPFRTRESKKYRIFVGVRSGSTVNTSVYGEPTWIDEIRIDKVASSAVEAGTADQARGFVLFSRSVMESLGIEEKLPSPAEMVDTLNIQLGRGEYEPALIGLYALRDMQGVDVSVSGDLVGPGNARIANKDVVVRRLQYELLPLSMPRDVKANEMLAWWVTAKAEKTCPVGMYRGELQVTASGKVVRRLPLQVEVLDLVLPKPDIAFFVHYIEGFFEPQFLTPELQQAYYRDMYEHGMTTVTVFNNGDVDCTDKIDFAHNYGYDKENPQFAIGLDTQMKWILDSGLCETGQPVPWMAIRSKKHPGSGYSWGRRIQESTLKATLAEWEKRKWPEPLLYLQDEPGEKGPRAERALTQLKTVKSFNLPYRTVTSGLGPDLLGKYYDVWIQGEHTITRETFQKAKELGAELWTYNCTSPNHNMPFSRAFYGFWAYRTGVKGVSEWAYYDLPRWKADEKGNAHGDPFTRHSRICASPNGPIPTISWEATREGIDDYRYAQLIGQLQTEAEELLKKLSSAAEKILTKQDRETIDKREGQKFSKFDPNEPVITWQASNSDKARGEQIYLISKQLAEEIDYAKKALDFVIRPIPFDAMTTRIALNYHMPKWARWCPPMGPQGTGENPVTITEDKRRVLVSYIISLKDALQKGKKAEASGT